MMILWREHGDIDKIQEKIKNVKSALQVFFIYSNFAQQEL